MKIAVDARSLTGRLSGIGRYTAEMLDALHAGGDDWTLHAPGALPGRWQHRERMRLVHGCARSRAGKLWWLLHRLPRAVNAGQPDLFWGPGHRLPQGLAPGIAQVVTLHDLVWRHARDTMSTSGYLMERWRVPRAIRQADAIIASSQSTRDDIVAQWPEVAARVHLAYCGVSALQQPSPAARLTELGVRGAYALFVGTREPRKNLRRVIEAFAALPSDLRHQAQLVIAGGQGWGGVDVERWTRAAGVADRVIVTGHVDDADLAALYRSARMLVMPSLYEGFGLPLVEAMSVGVPVLTADRASMPEVAGDAGLVVDPESVEAIRDAMVCLFTDTALVRQLGARGQMRAAGFSWQAAAASARGVFEAALHACQQRQRESR